MNILALVGTAPPSFIMPSLGDGLLGWLLGIIILFGPTFFLGMTWQRRTHNRSSFTTLLRNVQFWVLLFGSGIAATGIFLLIGAIPAWETAWTNWYLAVVSNNPLTDLSSLNWNQSLHQQYVFMLQITGAILFLLGAATVVISGPRLTRVIAKVQQRGPDDWLLSSEETGRHTAVPNVMDHPLS